MWTITAVVGYVLLCTRFRHSQKRAIEERFNYRDRLSLAKMTLEDAHAIQTWLAEQQFPSVFSAAIFFALFKVPLPGISTTPDHTQWAVCPPLTGILDVWHSLNLKVAGHHTPVRQAGGYTCHLQTRSRH